MIDEPIPAKVKQEGDKILFEVPLDIYQKYFGKTLDNDFWCDTVEMIEYDDEYQGLIFWSRSTKLN